MADIFLSYAREDRLWASRLAAGLIEHGWSLFWDPDIPVGKTFDQVIERQLDAAGCIVVLWSRHSVSSNWVKAEASEGMKRRVLHPVLIEKVRLPLEFRRLQTADLIDWQRGTPNSEYDQLISGIGATLRSSRARVERLQEARSALRRGDNTECLENLDKIVAATETTDPGEDVAELRRLAEAERGKARRRELDVQRTDAERRRATANASRLRAQTADAALRASAVWLAAEVKMGAASAAFDDEVYLRAGQYYEQAIDLYGQAGSEALKAAATQKVERERQAVERPPRLMRAPECEPSKDARQPVPLWIDAELSTTKRAAPADEHLVGAIKVSACEGQQSTVETADAAEPVHGVERYNNPDQGFEKAEVSVEPSGRATLARAAERHRAEGARVLMARHREAAQAEPHSAGATWADAEALCADGELAFQRGDYVKAEEIFERASHLYRRGVIDASPLDLDKPKDRVRRISRVGASRLAACVGLTAVVLGAFGTTYWNRSAHREVRSSSATVPSPTPQAPGPLPPPEPQPPTPSPRILQDVREQVAEARARAMKAGAGQFANALLASAAAHQRDAEGALAGGRVPDALAAYRQALDDFTAAAAQAEQVLQHKQDETTRLRGEVEDRRRRAAAAQAEQFAEPQWTNATRLYREAEAAVARGDYDKAGQLLKEASAGFDNAAKAANDVASTHGNTESSTARADAEQAQLRMADAKHAADQVAARFYVNRRYISGQSRERDGNTALKQSDYKTALRLFTEARSEYQLAAQEAKQEAERDAQLIPLQANLDQAHAEAAAQRKRALDAGADNLAADVFNQAQAVQVTADALANKHDLVAAARAYENAAERYADAMRRAQAARAVR